MLSAIIGFEVKYHFKQISFKIAALIFFLLGMVAVQGGFGSEVYKNGPYTIATITGLLSLCSIFAAVLLCASVVLRDTAYKMDAIIFTSSIKRFPYFFSRFTGLLTAVFVILCFAVAGMFAGSFLVPAEQRGPFNLIYFLQPLLIFGLPNLLFCSALIFCVGLFSGNTRAVYAAGVLLYVLYWVGAIAGDSPLLANSSLKPDGPGSLSLLADPFGLSVFFSETRSWTSAERNNQLFSLKGIILLNRLLWTGFALLLLILGYRFFKLQLKLPASKKDKTPARTVTNIPYRSVIPDPEGIRYHRNVFGSQLKLETISLFKHIPFMVMLILWIFMYAVEMRDSLFGGPYSIRYYPATSIILQELRSVKPAMFLIIFYAAELVWRERSVNIHGLVYSTPVPNAALWAAKISTLGILIAVIISSNIGIGTALQLMHGYTQLELARYASLYYYSGIPLLLFAVLIVMIMSFSSGKYLGMLLGLFTAALIVFSPRLGIEHYLLRYASVPELFYSSMNGFGHYAAAFNWYMLYWSGLAIVLSLITIAIWQNSRELPFGRRLRTAAKQWGKTGSIVLPAALFIWIGTGAWIYYQTNISGRYKNRLAQKEWQLEYEKRYRAIAGIYQPVIKDVKTNIDLYPSKQFYTVEGTYRLRNESDSPVTSLWLGTDPEVSVASFSVPSATEGLHDKDFNERRYDLETPLLPGKEMLIGFSLKMIRSGFVPFNSEHSVVENGSYIELEKYLPFLGYNDRYEWEEKTARRKKGLTEKPIALPADTAYHLVNYETTISTDAGQQVITVGELKNRWNKANRNYFQYKTTEPSPFMFALSSARYACIKEDYKGITLNICYEPGQTCNTAAMLQAMKNALDYGSAHFSLYPYKQLTLAEIPQYRGAATAYPGVIFSAENISFLGNFSDTTKLNQAYAITAHETAHQWWGSRFEPAVSPGNKFLTESLAKYAEVMILEHQFGKMHLRNYLRADNRLYAILRSLEEEEMPLDSVSGQPFVYYQKGGLAMYAIKESIGEKKLNQALQNMFTKHSAPGVKANPETLKQELYRNASAAQIALIDDLLNKTITWRLKLTLVECKPLADGRFGITLQANIVKNNGSYHSFKPIPLNDDMDIAVFEQTPDRWHRYTQPLYFQKHHFSDTETRFTLIVNKKPAAIAIDPYGYMLEEDQQDNIVLIKD
jgi:ABC-2 type transport system permease protein